MSEEKKTIDAWAKTAQIYKLDNQMVHVKLKNGEFYNGFILNISADFFFLEDRVVGRMPVFFVHIESLRKFGDVK